MAKGKRQKKQKRACQSVRNWMAVEAYFTSGGGKHQDRRMRRKRTRSAQKRAAIAKDLY
jgi:hypothetical protein